MQTEDHAEDSVIPSWINSEFLKEVLYEELKKDISVTNFNAKKALPKGEHYLSILYRVEIDYKENKIPNDKKYFLMIKTLPEGEFMQKWLEEMRGFQKESHMYNKVLPEICRLIKSAKGDVSPLSAKRLSCKREDTIIMEDLKYHGYKMAMRKEGLDLDQCKITLRALARFHAASIALCKNDPTIKDIYVEGMYRNDEALQTYMKNDLNILASVVNTWKGFEKFGEKLSKIGLTALDRMIEMVKPKENSFNVLNHGDCWINNILFRYSPQTGKVEDVKFIDFQITRYSSPALDLQYFICNCPNDEVRFQHRDTLLEEYYSELSEYCKALNLDSDLITLEQLKEEFEEKTYLD